MIIVLMLQTRSHSRNYLKVLQVRKLSKRESIEQVFPDLDICLLNFK